jgi:hypothetical protein
VPGLLAHRDARDALFRLDIVEVAGTTKRPVELVAEIYFDLSARLGLPWLRERIAALPADAHWQMLARGAMHDRQRSRGELSPDAAFDHAGHRTAGKDYRGIQSQASGMLVPTPYCHRLQFGVERGTVT